MRKKLILINPVNPDRNGLTINESSRFPPIGLGIIAALTPESWDIKLIDENWNSFSYEDADLVGITAFTASANRAYKIAAVFREKNIPVIMGGIHASLCSDEALKFVDCVVIGEVESVWPTVLEDFEKNRLAAQYQGSLPNLKNMVSPKRDIFHPNYQFASIQTSRGCPMDCDFCSVTAFNGFRYRRRPIDDVLREIKAIPQKMIFFVDDNIVGYGKESRNQAIALFKGIADLRLNKWWFCQASINFADDNELLYWAKKAGCKMVFLGIETEEIDTLEEVSKKLNISRGVDSYNQSFKRIQKAGIAVLGAFIFGMDKDNKTRLLNRAKYCVKSRIDVIQATILTPLPGTRLYKNLEQQERLFYNNYPKDWDYYDMTEVVFKPQTMTKNELNEEMKMLGKKIYSWPVLLKKALRTLFYTKNLMAMMFAFNSNLNYRNVGLYVRKIKIM